MERLADVGVASLTHHLLQALEVFISLDPSGVFLLSHRILKSGQKGSYQFESLAIETFVKFVERFLAEYRFVFQSNPECRTALIRGAGYFRAGWMARSTAADISIGRDIPMTLVRNTDEFLQEFPSPPPVIRKVSCADIHQTSRDDTRLGGLSGAAKARSSWTTLVHVVSISAFPQGSLWRERPQKRGVAPSTSTLLVRRAVGSGEGGIREAQPRFAFPQPTREIRVVPRRLRRFGEVPHHNGEGCAL